MATENVYSNEELDSYKTPQWFADRRGVKISTLNIERCKGRGPKYYKLSNRVRYKLRDILEWEESCLRVPGDK